MLDGRVKNTIPEPFNKTEVPGVNLLHGVYIGVVKNHVDTMRRGRLQVWIPDLGGEEDNPAHWRTVSYASPFFGATTPINPDAPPMGNVFNQTQQTYGFWGASPDINNHVLVVFVAGDPTRGYWFACVPNTVSHYMVPGIANDPSSGDLSPVSEFNQYDKTVSDYTRFPFNKKPVHSPMLETLKKQGLDKDTVRGVTTSSSHRESPSRVFGWSTPGRPVTNRTGAGVRDKIIPTRVGGHMFVMDDGDIEDKDRLIRLRTAGGHQIMMNDSEKVLYISNSEGTAWLEFDEDGKIHIFANDSFSLRSKRDINLHADNSINMHAGNSINQFAGSTIKSESQTITSLASVTWHTYGGNIISRSNGGYTLNANGAFVVASNSVITLSGTGTKLQSGAIPITVNPPPNISIINHADVPGSTSSAVKILPTHEPSPVHKRKSSGAKGPIKVTDVSTIPAQDGSTISKPYTKNKRPPDIG